ncbi:MAG: hypothetical protein ACYC7D_00170 [Nitrososphaerales archaeon]
MDSRKESSWRPPSLRELFDNPLYSMVMVGAASFFMMSIFIHFPLNNSPMYYSDIVDTFWYQRLSAAGVPSAISGIPYITYFFEYPPVCGLILWLGGWASGGNVMIFAAIEFGVLLGFFLLLTHFTYLFLDNLGLGHTRQLIFSVFVPSILFYGAYNYDIVQAFFTIAALYFFIARPKYELSAIFLGLAVATKISPVFLLPLFWQEMRSNSQRIWYTLITGATIAAMNVPFMAAHFSLWLQSYQYLANWGLEDSFLVWIFPENVWNVAKELSLALIVISSLSIYLFLNRKPLLVRAFLITGVFLLFSYIATPQLNLDLLPFFSLVPVVPISLFYLFEITDVLIILTWFIYPNPTLPGLSQTFALLRQIYLVFILVLVMLSKYKSSFQEMVSKVI